MRRSRRLLCRYRIQPVSRVENPHSQPTLNLELFAKSAEVAKTRLQLQGELQKGSTIKVYNSAADALAKTWRNEGLRGIQRGLGPAVRHLACPLSQ
jgi:hypothetical protein